MDIAIVERMESVAIVRDHLAILRKILSLQD